MIKKIKLFIVAVICVVSSACGIYSFSGASYGKAKTFSIDYFQNMASLVVPTLSTTFTEGLKEYFVKRTPLEMVNKDADLTFEGAIRDYSVQSLAVTAEEVASKNRLTITVNVKFVNRTDEKWSFDRSFSAYEDFPSTQSISSVEGQLIETIVEKLIEDIFNASVANW